MSCTEPLCACSTFSFQRQIRDNLLHKLDLDVTFCSKGKHSFSIQNEILFFKRMLAAVNGFTPASVMYSTEGWTAAYSQLDPISGKLMDEPPQGQSKASVRVNSSAGSWCEHTDKLQQ